MTQLETIVSIGRLGIIVVWGRRRWRRVCVNRVDVTFRTWTKGITLSATLIVGLAWCSRGGVQTPLGLQWLVNLSGGAELEVASLLGDDRALVGGLQAGNQLGLEAAGLLWVQVTDFFWHVNERGQGLVVTLLRSLLCNAASTADLDWQLLTGSVTNKLPRLLLNIAGGTTGLIHSPTLIGPLSVADFLQGLVALLDSFVDSLLLEGDLTSLFKVLVAHLLLSRGELCDVGVMALFDVGVGTLKDGVLFNGLHSFFFFNTTQTTFRVIDTITKVHSTWDGITPVSSKPWQDKGS